MSSYSEQSRIFSELVQSIRKQAETSKHRMIDDDDEPLVRLMHRCFLQWILPQHCCRVYYRSRKFNGADVHHYIILARGNISQWGIQCDCCLKMFSISAFEKHAAGSTNHDGQASTFIYLEEYGRTLMSLIPSNMRSCNTTATYPSVKFFNDDICSICHCDRDQDDYDPEGVIMCDKCQSVFHLSCVPYPVDHHGLWTCPSCCCGVCGHGDFQEGITSTVKYDHEQVHQRLVVCKQCETNYHAGCLGDRAIVFYSEGTKKYFCSRGCENIYLGLTKILLGKPVPLDTTAEGDNNLTWTLLKYTRSGLSILDMAKIYKHLQKGVDVMHECLSHASVTYNQRVVAEDVILNHMSDLRPLNFVGFYTVFLKKGSEVVTVATVRIYGQKVAEIPLIATRSQYRRLGMCKLLMNELEKQLSVLEVERLIVHAPPNALKICINSLGFSKMTRYERLSLAKYTFLDFPDTIMCHKLLKKSESSTPSSTIKFESDNVQVEVEVEEKQ